MSSLAKVGGKRKRSEDEEHLARDQEEEPMGSPPPKKNVKKHDPHSASHHKVRPCLIERVNTPDSLFDVHGLILIVALEEEEGLNC